MSELPITRAASKVLAEEKLDLPTASSGERERMVRAIKEEIERSARARRRRAWAGRLIAAAVVFLAVLGTWKLASRGSDHVANTSAPDLTTTAVASSAPSPVPISDVAKPSLVAESVHGTVDLLLPSGRARLAPLDPVKSGQTVSTQNGDATIAFVSGSRVQLEALTEATLTEDSGEQLVAIRTGAVTATVAKLGDRGRFIVRTDEAVVEAHGTVFRVERKNGAPGTCANQTLVHLTEGRISVRDPSGERFLSPGQDWASECKSTLASVPSVSSVSRATIVAPKEPPTSSELTAQNALFSRAMAQKASGDKSGAVATLDELLTSYPNTQLREVACAQRMNIAATYDPARGHALAKSYAAEFPHGFARRDADAILAVP